MVAVEAITHCKTPTCKASITVYDVFREKLVEQAPEHSVLIYRCPVCERVDRIVTRNDDWDLVREREEYDELQREKIMRAFIIDMGLFENVDELIQLWLSYKTPPPLERGRRNAR